MTFYGLTPNFRGFGQSQSNYEEKSNSFSFQQKEEYGKRKSTERATF